LARIVGRDIDASPGRGQELRFPGSSRAAADQDRALVLQRQENRQPCRCWHTRRRRLAWAPVHRRKRLQAAAGRMIATMLFMARSILLLLARPRRSNNRDKDAGAGWMHVSTAVPSRGQNPNGRNL